MKVVILCGGLGTRLYPLTKTVQKCMLPIKDKPILEHQIEYLKSQGFTDIVLAVGYLKEDIIDYFGDGSKFGVNITYSYDDRLGTGGAIKNTNLAETFIVLNGDTLINVDLNDLLKYHRQKITIVITKIDNPERYGVLVNGKFVEKANVKCGLVNCGVYVVEPKILNYIPSNKYCSLEKDIFPNLSLGFYYFKNGFTDIGTHESYNEVVRV